MANDKTPTTDRLVTELERSLAESAESYKRPPEPKPARVVDGVVHLRPVNEK